MCVIRACFNRWVPQTFWACVSRRKSPTASKFFSSHVKAKHQPLVFRPQTWSVGFDSTDQSGSAWVSSRTELVSVLLFKKLYFFFFLRLCNWCSLVFCCSKQLPNRGPLPRRFCHSVFFFFFSSCFVVTLVVSRLNRADVLSGQDWCVDDTYPPVSVWKECGR